MIEEISFGTWLRQQRRALDLSQQAFANQVGCAEITLRRIEKDVLRPSKELATLLLDKLGIPASDQPQWISFARGLSGFPPSLSTQPSKPITNLPAALTTFVGREKEQLDIMRLSSKHRLVTLTGLGGVGKTRLAMKVGEQTAGRYLNGVWLIELASVINPALIPLAAANALGLRNDPQRKLTDMVCEYLGEKRVLLILDNCEHILAGCAAFTFSLLNECSQLHILATSRESLGVTGEALYLVPSLGVPNLEPTLVSMRTAESVQLFEERAQLAQFDFTLTAENALSIAQICQRLDGIPLAIELAAANAGRYSPENIARQLDESFHLLTTKSRTASPRHQTLRASIDWSWNLLTESEQRIMRQLSVFVGGWTLEAAQAVCDGDVRYLLGSLVTKSLIVMKQRKGTTIRYAFHESIRQYADERLEEAGETAVTRDKHCAALLAFVEKAEPEVIRAEQKLWIDRLEDEHDNIRAAIRWCIGKQKAEQALRFCSALSIFWERHKHYHEAAQACKDALACVKQNDALNTTAWYAFVLVSSAYYIAHIESIPWSDPSIRKQFVQSQKIYDELDDYNSAGSVLTAQIMTFSYMDSNDISSAESSISYWYEKVKATGYQWGIALALRTKAQLAMAQHQANSAVILWQQGYDLCMEIGDTWAAMDASRFLIWQKIIRGEFQIAIRLLRQTCLFYEEYGDPGGVAVAYYYLGIIAREKGEYESARRYFTDNIKLHIEIGNKRWSIDGVEQVAYLDYLEGNTSEARVKYETVFADIKEIPDTSKHGGFYFRFAELCLSEKDLAGARTALMTGLEITQTNNQTADIHAAYYGLGELARLEGDHSEAIKNYYASLDAVQGDLLYIEVPRILDGIAKTEHLLSNHDKAARLFGVSQALRKKWSAVIHASDLPDFEKYVQLLQNRMNAAEFKSAWAAGEKMDVQAVCEYAMHE